MKTGRGGCALYSSERVAPDGRPTVEIQSASLDGRELRLSGTACVYEATLLVHIVDQQGERTVGYITATAGGPERGAWETVVPLERLPAEVYVGEEDMEAGDLAPTSTVRLAVDDGGLRRAQQ